MQPLLGNNFHSLVRGMIDSFPICGQMTSRQFHEWIDHKFGIETDGTLDPENWAKDVLSKL